MDNQILISISREFGSGGRVIATELAKRFQLPLYDHNILEQVAQEVGVHPETLKRYDESPKNVFISRTVKGFSNSPEENVARMQFDYLRRMAASGTSFLVLGRCGEEVLKDFPNLISIFILSDISFKKARIMERDGISSDEALELLAKTDRQRKYYHNQFCRGKWGDSRNYDLCINSARLGLDGTIDFVERYIRARIQ